MLKNVYILYITLYFKNIKMSFFGHNCFFKFILRFKLKTQVTNVLACIPPIMGFNKGINFIDFQILSS